MDVWTQLLLAFPPLVGVSEPSMDFGLESLFEPATPDRPRPRLAMDRADERECDGDDCGSAAGAKPKAAGAPRRKRAMDRFIFSLLTRTLSLALVAGENV